MERLQSWFWEFVQPIPFGVTFSKAVWKPKAQSSNVSFHWNVAKDMFELWAVSFETAFEYVTPSGMWCVCDGVCAMMYLSMVCVRSGVPVLSSTCPVCAIWCTCPLATRADATEKFWKVSPLLALLCNETTKGHTATHCNTLQHTATHCNTLQHTATHCFTLQHTATHCNTLQRISPPGNDTMLTSASQKSAHC